MPDENESAVPGRAASEPAKPWWPSQLHMLVWITCGALLLALAFGGWHEGLMVRLENGELYEPSDAAAAGALGYFSAFFERVFIVAGMGAIVLGGVVAALAHHRSTV
ncbi:hypothetical protein [Microbacterium dauci]|uniref:Uncharacterized protein n=1 Tax=Microbacterium dauci TaxID=3048008 RepID=A0ABT6ZE55_9MICO|nr:hypothetical protein [Microbacterium sp. LX3-4]MDJ1114445.1 hypothetical protein [Microbacterium sp. LX3-4]